MKQVIATKEINPLTVGKVDSLVHGIIYPDVFFRNKSNMGVLLRIILHDIEGFISRQAINNQMLYILIFLASNTTDASLNSIS